MKTMIYHIPLPFDYESKSASGIRPIKMLNAFKELGYEVIEISGYSSERKRKIKNAKQAIKNGKKIDFVYSESSTMPTLLTDPHHLPFHPFIDFGFFKFCKRKNIPIGLFYRDIYWKFPELYDKETSNIKAFMGKIFYRYDLKCYNKLLKILYLPTQEMARYLGNFSYEIQELPPGRDNVDLKEAADTETNNHSVVNFLYIGGIGYHYQVHKIFKAVANDARFTLTLCTRKNEWEEQCSQYLENNLMPSNINVVHFSGAELEDLYKKADIALIFLQPQEYWEVIFPFKMSEYIGHQIPILASDEIYPGKYVKKANIGWAIPYEADALKIFLDGIMKEEILQKKKNVYQFALHSRWLDRAAKVVADMKE
jgi:hypothetical protein